MGYTTVSNNSANTVSNNATESNEAFVDTWSLKAFADMFVGKPRRETALYKNGEKAVKGLRFTSAEGKYTFVAFAKALGNVGDADLKAAKEGTINLRVGKNEEGFYYLYKGSSVTFEVGEEVDW